MSKYITIITRKGCINVIIQKYLNIKLLFYIIVSLFYMEIILNLSIFRSFSLLIFFNIYIFYYNGTGFCLFSSLANPKINKAIYIILLVLTGFIFLPKLFIIVSLRCFIPCILQKCLPSC